jgi:rod shape-determining protein MreC
MRFIYTKTFIRIFTIFVGIALLVILDANGYLGLAKDGFLRVYGSSVSRIRDGTQSVKVVFETLFTVRKIVSDNNVLNQKVDELSFENARLKSALDENIGLRQALNFKQQSQLNLIAVEVLNADPTGFSQVIIIDKGANANLLKNQPVVVSPGLLIGKITKLNPNSAEVTLITDPSILVSAEVVDSGARGLVKGEHGLGLSLDLVTQNELIKTGDKVVTSGLSDDFPKGLLIGDVAGINSSSTALFQKAAVSPAADLRSLRFLFVVL